MMPEPTAFVVDDDEAVCSALRFLGEAINLNVETYSSAQVFLDSYDPRYPGCLVLDLRMPGMNGLELQAQLAVRGIRIPIIFITGHGDAMEVRRARQAGAMDVIEKPFNAEVLIERIQQAIRQDLKRRGHPI